MKSLFSKLLIAHLLSLIVAFGLLAILLRQVLYPYYIDRVVGDQMLERGAALAKQIAPLLKKEDRSALNEKLEIVKASLGAEVCLVDMNREILAHATPPSQRAQPIPITTCCDKLETHGPGVETREAALTACGEDMLVAAVKIYPHDSGLLEAASQPVSPADNSGASASVSEDLQTETSAVPIAMLLLRMPIADIHAAAGRVWQLILLCALLGAALAFATAMLLADRISGPLRRMRRMTANMAKGEFGVQLKAKGKDEVGQLAASFNSMAGQLQSSLASLEDESAKLRGVLSSMAEGVVAVSGDQRILLANPQTFGVLNIPQQELVNRSLAETGLPEELVKALQVCLAERKMINAEISTSAFWQMEDPEHTPEPSVAAIHVVPMHLGQESWGAVAVIRDVSEERRLDGMRRRFFSDISHELRTPLTNITGFAAALEDGTASDEASRAQAISIIAKESDRLKRFIEDLLDLSRLESGHPDLQKESCELEPIASASAESLQPLAEQAKVKIHLDLPRDLPQVFADPHRLSQVFVNLISNAIRFNRPGGEVIVSASAEPTEIKVTVKDTGVGIPAEELPYVWGRFHRGSTVTQNENLEARGGELQTKGSGLGLAIFRGIIQAHGGRVWVDSTPGQGSTFGFSLPTG